MRSVGSAGFALFCVLVMAAIVVPAARAQLKAVPEGRARDARSLAQRKIDPSVLTAIYHRRGDAKGKTVQAAAAGVQVDRHGRALVDVRAQVRPELEKKIKALGGVVVSTSRNYDSIVGWMPLLMLERLAADATVRAIQPAQ
ncbi:MAG TPA: hypothetical protein VF921_06580 [Vicinamibacterales bacterium]